MDTQKTWGGRTSGQTGFAVRDGSPGEARGRDHAWTHLLTTVSHCATFVTTSTEIGKSQNPTLFKMISPAFWPGFCRYREKCQS